MSHVKKAWWHLVRRGRDQVNRLLYGAAGPLVAERLYIDPADVHHYLATRVTRHDTGRVLNGDWDQARTPLDELPKIHICNQHFVQGKSWQDAGAYEHMAVLLTRKTAPDGCRSMEDVYQRYHNLDAFHEQLKQGQPFLNKTELDGAKAFREERGIYIHVGHDGALLFGKRGCHRLAIARILRLPVVPVQLGVVHRQALRSGAFARLRERSRTLQALRDQA